MHTAAIDFHKGQSSDLNHSARLLSFSLTVAEVLLSDVDGYTLVQ